MSATRMVHARREDCQVRAETPSRCAASQEAMRNSPLILSIGVLAALSGWMVRGIQLNAETSPLPQPATQVVMSEPADTAPRLSVDRPADFSHASRSTRNLFAYREPEIPRAKPAVFDPPPVAV